MYLNGTRQVKLVTSQFVFKTTAQIRVLHLPFPGQAED